ncbi:MAG: LLM class flavin-dependent oxidoreductase [Deltaproteobacteria bacterium]|nr:LLM class flavin-dependent oxidoreductase [Deltaproteobacteria bacterium]MBI3388794.1 LLM class flavin-dependent oxidoreductase [Deltaproteobacteria bacterium]
MEYGLQVGNVEFPQLHDIAQTAEGLGFHAIMMPDHIVAEGPERQFDPHHLSYDPMVMVAVMAAATKKIQVGHLVLCNLFRHPVITAQSLNSLDRLSGGRLFAGLGTGWTEREFKMTGIQFPDITTRLRMLDEALTVIRSLWTKEETTFAGEFYHLKDAILFPKPVQKPHPPILLGGGGKGLLRLAAKHADIINIISDAGKPGYIKMENVQKLTNDAFRAKVQFVRNEAKQHGRDGAKIRISNVLFTAIVTDSAAATKSMAEGMAPMFGTTPEGLLQSPMALLGTPEECIKELKRRQREWDVSQVIFSGALGELGLKRVAEEVMPHV